VAVDGAKGDVGLGGDVPHLHRLEAAPLGEPERGVEHSPAPGGLAAGEGRARRGAGGGGGHRRIETRCDSGRQASPIAAWETARMAADLLDLADRLWRGATDIRDHHPIAGMWGEIAELGPGTAFVAAFSNVAAFATDDGMVLVDTSSPFLAGR